MRPALFSLPNPARVSDQGKREPGFNREKSTRISAYFGLLLSTINGSKRGVGGEMKSGPGCEKGSAAFMPLIERIAFSMLRG